jgi:hypothetical protein
MGEIFIAKGKTLLETRHFLASAPTELVNSPNISQVIIPMFF